MLRGVGVGEFFTHAGAYQMELLCGAPVDADLV